MNYFTYSEWHMTPQVKILSGIPCSGKSTYAKHLQGQWNWTILSRDEIRLQLFGKNYKQNTKDEKKVNVVFYDLLKESIRIGSNIVIDNTNCKLSYINELKTWFPRDYDVEIVYFPISLLRAYYRNVIRWIKTGKFIPFGVIRSMKRNFDKMNKK